MVSVLVHVIDKEEVEERKEAEMEGGRRSKRMGEREVERQGRNDDGEKAGSGTRGKESLSKALTGNSGPGLINTPRLIQSSLFLGSGQVTQPSSDCLL